MANRVSTTGIAFQIYARIVHADQNQLPVDRQTRTTRIDAIMSIVTPTGNAIQGSANQPDAWTTPINVFKVTNQTLDCATDNTADTMHSA